MHKKEGGGAVVFLLYIGDISFRLQIYLNKVDTFFIKISKYKT